MKILRTIACVSDLHCGTSYGLAPPGFKNDEGSLLELNQGQQILLDHWHRYIGYTHDEEVDTVVYLGDLCHGQNPKGRGIQMMTTDIDIQQQMTYEILKPIAMGRRNYFVHGSGYHAQPVPGVNAERNVCNLIGKLPDTQSEWWGPFAIRYFEPSIKNWLIQHGESQAYIYREMILGRDNLHTNAATGLDRFPKIDVTLKGHWHDTIALYENGQHILQNGCFCMFIPWRGTLRNIAKFQPTIGGLIIKIYEGDTIVVEPKEFKPVPKIVGQVDAA